MHTAALDQLLPVETASPEETAALGEAVAQLLSPGAVVALYGDLGAGKTHFAKGFFSAYGVPADAVSSPTFTIAHEYPGALPLYHLDAYRLRSTDEFFELGHEDYLYSKGLCLIEWPERVEALLPDHTLRLRLSHVSETRRRIERTGP